MLITLGIIGVVAAMTMPSLIHKFQNKALETQYKKSISVVSQAVLKAKADSGIDNFAQYCAYYPYDINSGKPYDHAKECYEILFKSLINKGINSNYKVTQNFVDRKRGEIIKTYNNEQSVTVNDLAGIGGPIFNTYAMPDGSYISFEINERNIYAGIDTNGSKKPNKLGHDIFVFKINSKNDALAAATNKPEILSDEELDNIEYDEGKEYVKERAGNPCNLTSSQKANGIGCSYYALKNECPYDSSKTYFDCLP